jgi:hypothetical protein
MPEASSRVLPLSVANTIPDTTWLHGNDALALLNSLTLHLTRDIDARLKRFEPLKLLPELGFQVAYGLPAADETAIDSGRNRASLRPPRFELPAPAVGMAARVALERAALLGPLGNEEPTSQDIGDIVVAAAAYVDLDAYRDIASLAPAPGKPAMGAVSVRKDGPWVHVNFEVQDFDFLGYQRMREHRILDSDPVDLDVYGGFIDGVPPEFAELSDSMMTDLGFGLDDLISVLVAGIRINFHQEMQCCVVEAQHFRDEILPQVSAHAVEAFDFLTFSSDYLDLEHLRPSGTRHQRRRLVTHPFLVHSGCVYLSRDLQFEAYNRWTTYLLNGDWPVPATPRKDMWPNLDAAITRRRDDRGTQAFEPFVEAELDASGLPWGSTSSANATIGATRITGEVDAMVVDAAAGTLWVLEFKDVTSDQNVRSLQSELEYMLTKHGRQVERTAGEVERDPAGVARHLVQEWARRHNRDRADTQMLVTAVEAVASWSVRPVMVVRDRSAAEFLMRKPWDVTPVSGLQQLLRASA